VAGLVASGTAAVVVLCASVKAWIFDLRNFASGIYHTHG
jgi:hypothetical protein